MCFCNNFLTLQKSPPFDLAVDIGCGSGQSSRSLTPHFKQVVGTEVSEVQLLQARSKSSETNLTYRYDREKSALLWHYFLCLSSSSCLAPPPLYHIIRDYLHQGKLLENTLTYALVTMKITWLLKKVNVWNNT